MDVPPVAMSSARSVTTSDRAELVTDTKFESPAYTAVIECVPPVRVDVLYVAIPDANGAEPSSVAPSKKSTFPLGVPTEEDMVAVNVTLSVNAVGFADVSKAIDGEAFVPVPLATMLCVTLLPLR